MTDNTAPAEVEIVAGGPAADEQLDNETRRPWFPIRVVRTRTLTALVEQLDQADDAADLLEAEAEKWHAAYCTEVQIANDAEERLDSAGDRASALEQQVEELSNRLAEAGREAEHMNRSFRAVCEERDEERAARKHLQQAGRDLTAAFTSENREAEPILDAIGRVLIRNAHRFELGADELADIPRPAEPCAGTSVEDEERAELLRAAYRYPHDSTEPAIIADHLPHCEACAESLPTLAPEALVEAGRTAQQTGKTEALWAVLCEADRRRTPTAISTTAGKELDQ